MRLSKVIRFVTAPPQPPTYTITIFNTHTRILEVLFPSVFTFTVNAITMKIFNTVLAQLMCHFQKPPDDF